MAQQSLKKLVLLLLVLMPVGVGFGQPTADIAKLGQAYEVLSIASGNGGDVDSLVLVFNQLVSLVNSGSYDIVEVENVLDGIIELAERINEQALIESRNELLRVVATVLVVVLVEVFLWRGFPRLYWSQWLKRRGDWTVK